MDEIERQKLASVLLVEDDPDDVEITRRAFRKGRIANPLHVVRDGEEALEYLRRSGRYADPDQAPRPGLILLDLNLPRVDGRELLQIIKSTPELRALPVVVLTSSSQEEDVFGCYDSGANTYMTKPVEFDKFLQAVMTIGRYWFCFAELTKNPEGA